MYGKMIPVGGGDPIPLLKSKLMIGRRESCDIVLRFSNVSAHHCELYIHNGYWFVKDLGSRNGTKVGNHRVTEQVITPGETISVAKHKYEFVYSPHDLGAVGPPPTVDRAPDEIMGKSLLERAGLVRERDPNRRYDVTNDRAGQIRDRNKPV